MTHFRSRTRSEREAKGPFRGPPNSEWLGPNLWVRLPDGHFVRFPHGVAYRRRSPGRHAPLYHQKLMGVTYRTMPSQRR